MGNFQTVPPSEPAQPPVVQHISLPPQTDSKPLLLRRQTTLPYQPILQNHVEQECEPLFSDSTTEEGWEVVFEDGERLKVWKRQHPVHTKAFEYALRGRSPYSPHVFFQTAYRDLNYRMKWDESCSEAKVLSVCPSTKIETLYWVTKYPWPIAERDYVFHRFMSKQVHDDTYHCVSWVGTVPPYAQESPKEWKRSEELVAPSNTQRVRVSDYATTMLVKPDGKEGAIWALRVLDDPKVAFIPASVINWVVSKTLPNSATKLDKACKSRQGE